MNLARSLRLGCSLLMIMAACSAPTSNEAGTEEPFGPPKAQFSYGGGPVSVSAVGGNGITLTLTAVTNRIGLEAPPTDNFYELSYVNEFFPDPWPGHNAEVVIDSIWFHRDYDGYSGQVPSIVPFWDHTNTPNIVMPFDVYFPHSYTLHVDAHVEGQAVRLSIHVNVLPCLIPEQQPVDSLINDEGVRRALKMALDSSPPTGSPWDRRERGGIRMLLPDGTTQDFLLAIKSNDTPCSFYFAGALEGLPGIPILAWHSHPFSPGDPNDPLPYNASLTPRSNCPHLDSLPPPPLGKVRSAKPGPSKNDKNGPDNSGFPHLIIDKSRVYLIDGPANNQYQRSWKLNASCNPLGVLP